MIVVLIILIDGFVTPQTPGSLLEPATQYIFPANVSLLDVTRLNIFRHFMSSPEKIWLSVPLYPRTLLI